MKLTEKVKTALDEIRILIMGAQILLGFQLCGVFADAFEELPSLDRFWFAAVNRQGTGPPIGIQSGPPFAHRDKPGWDSISTAVLEAPALVAGFDDVAVMSQSIQQRGCHFGIAEDARPFGEGEIGRDNNRGALI